VTLAGQIVRRDQITRGIAFMVAASLMFSITNAMVKWEVDLYPIGEVAFVRTIFGFTTLCVMILPRTGLEAFRTRRPFAHAKRAASQFTSMLCMMGALSLMPLADATAIGFTAPLFTTLLSIVILKDRVGIHRWSALVVGFVGVLLITRPGHGGFQIGAAYALLNAVMISTVAIAIRRMSMTESTETLTLCQMGLITLFSFALLPFGWTSPAWADLALLAVAGVGNGIAQFWWTKALHIAPPSAVVPFQYLSLVWTGSIGFAVWGDLPTGSVVAGAVIVVASGLYILWRETVRRRQAAAGEPA
jgi:drug/metabolite transporter (DMT)-like permease